MTYWYSVAGRNLALRKTKKVDNYIKSKSNALRADDVRVPVNGPVSELDLFGLCSGASPQLQEGVVDLLFSKRICIFELPTTGNSIGTLWKTKRYGNDCELSPFQKPPSDIQGKEFGLKQPIVCFYTLYFNLKFN